MWMNKARWILYSNNFLSILTHISRSSEFFFSFSFIRSPFVFLRC